MTSLSGDECKTGHQHEWLTYEGILDGWFVGPMRETQGCVITDDFICAYIEHINVLNPVKMRTLVFEAHWNTMERSSQLARTGEFLVELCRLLLRVFKED